jgi:hypothetical protein
MALKVYFVMLKIKLPSSNGVRGGAVVGALRYKPEGRGVDSRWYHWTFFIDILVILLVALWPWGRLSL